MVRDRKVTCDASEERDRGNVFDIELLAPRLTAVTDHARAEHPNLPIGYFGASTGAAAALRAAAEPGACIGAIVSRGGRPDLAMPHLRQVRAPTLLLVGGADDVVLQLNREAARRLQCEHELKIVPGATHLFEEPGALEHVAASAADWFTRHLTRPVPARTRPTTRTFHIRPDSVTGRRLRIVLDAF